MGKQALEGGRLNAFSMDPEALVVVTDPKHALFDPRALLEPDEALTLSIMAEGVREPVLVIKEGDGAPLVVDGRQRVLAAREANKRLVAAGKIPARVPVMSPLREKAERAFGLSVLLNELRRDDELLAKIEKLKRLLVYGYSEEDCAIRFGVGDQTIRNWLDIDALHPEVKKLIAAGKIAPTAALALKDTPEPLQPQKARELIEAGATSRDAVERAVRGERTTKKKHARTAQPKSRLVRLYKIMVESGVVDSTYPLLLAWVLGIEDVDDQALVSRIKGWAGCLRGEADAEARRKERGKKRGGGDNGSQ